VEIRPWLGVFLLVGLFNVAVPFALISWSEQYIGSGVASILNSTVPLFTMIISPIFLRDERWTLPKFLGLLIGFSGVVVLFFARNRARCGPKPVGSRGDAAGCVIICIGVDLRPSQDHGLSPRIQSFLQLAWATVLMWGFTLLVDSPVKLPHLPLTWVALLWLGLLGSCVAYIFFFSLLHSIGPTKTTMVTYVLPLVGVILGAIFLKEQLYWQVLLGGAMIISGIAIVNIKWRPVQKPALSKE